MEKYLKFKEFIKTLDYYDFDYREIENYCIENKLAVREYLKKDKHVIINFKDNTLVDLNIKPSGNIVKIQKGIIRLGADNHFEYLILKAL